MQKKTVIYFTGDAHLGASCHTSPMEVERRLVRWLYSIANTAKAVYFMGDMFDYWFEYRYVVPKGYVRFLGALAHLSDNGVELHMLAGNHDVWMRQYFEQELGVVVHHQPFEVSLLGRIFRLSHGDYEYRTNSFSQRFLYSLFRNKGLQKLFAAVHPDCTMGFALWWSYQNRKKHQRVESKAPSLTNASHQLLNPDVEWLYRCTEQYKQANPQIDTFVYGHRHLLVQQPLSLGGEMIVTGDWLIHNSYVSWDGTSLTLHSFE